MLRRLGFVSFAIVPALAFASSAGIAIAQQPAPTESRTPPETQPPTESETAMAQLAEEEARALFNAGLAAYEAGRFEDALWSFQRAYDRSGRPELLYNVGQCHDRLRQDTLAIEAFRRYLELLPGAGNRHQVEARLRVLEIAVARQATIPTPTEVAASAADPTQAGPAGGLDPSPNSHRGRRVALITTASVVVVAAAVVVTLLVAGGGGAHSESDVGTVFALGRGAR